MSEKKPIEVKPRDVVFTMRVSEAPKPDLSEPILVCAGIEIGEQDDDTKRD